MGERRTQDVSIWNENSEYSVEVTDEGKIKSDVSGKAETPCFVVIRDKDFVSRQLMVTASGELRVVMPPPLPPSGTTYIENTQQSSVAGTSDVYTTIPIGERIIIQRFKAGSGIGNGGSKVELWYAPNGNTTGIVLIDALYVDGNSSINSLDYELEIGNGTRAILLRRVAIGGGGREIFGKWEGYY